MITPTSGTLVVAPATSEKVADGIWISSIRINAPSPLKPISAMISVVPFNSSNGETFPNSVKHIHIQNVEAESVTYPGLAVAMGAIISGVNDIVTGRALF